MKPKGHPIDVRFWAFLALLAYLAFDLSRVAFIESHPDEDACMAIGWLLSKGWRLYGDVFSHHMPLDYIPSWAVASLAGNRLEAFRGCMILMWATTCLGLYVALRRRDDASTRLVPYLFACLSSQWLTFWMGQMMLVESYWGYIVVLLLAIIGGPLGLPERPVDAVESVLAGFLLAVLLSASLTCVLPFACLLIWLAADPDWRKAWKGLLAGAVAWSGLLLLWCARHVDLSQWYAQVVWFNTHVYPRFYGFQTGHLYSGFLAAALKDTAAYFAAVPHGSLLEWYFEGLIKIGALGWIVWSFARRNAFRGAWWLVFIVAVKARAERFAFVIPFHTAPFYLAATLLVAIELSRLWALVQRRSSLRLSAAAALAAAIVLAPTIVATSMATASLKGFAKADPAREAAVSAIRRCTAPADPIAAFPFGARYYLETSRVPAVPNVLYLPWQAAWEPQHAATLAGLAQARPKAVIIEDTEVWGVPWKEYGRDVEAEVRKHYVPVPLGPESGEPARVRLYVQRFARAGAGPLCGTMKSE